jgi:hypothetical protein
VNWEIAVSIGTAVVGGVWVLLEHRGRKRAEKELNSIRRRGAAPFLQVSNDAFNGLYVPAANNQIQFCSAGAPFLLCFLRDEVDQSLPNGDQVLVVIENTGQTARRVGLKLDGIPVRIGKEADFSSAHGLSFIEYPYDRSLHGKEQKLTISFETSEGIQDTHTYLTRHGFRTLQRIDPV